MSRLLILFAVIVCVSADPWRKFGKIPDETFREYFDKFMANLQYPGENEAVEAKHVQGSIWSSIWGSTWKMRHSHSRTCSTVALRRYA
jgi:hypothetical protein